MARYTIMIEIAKEHMGKHSYTYIGICAQEVPAEIGEVMSHQSYVWEDGNQTDERLPGVCAVDIEYLAGRTASISDPAGYPGEYIVVLGADEVEYGEDAGEIIMRQPAVLAMYEVEK